MRPSVASARRLYDLHGDKLRFLLVGVFNTVFSYALFAVLLTLLDSPLRTLSSSTQPGVAPLGDHYYAVVQWINWMLCVPPNTLAMKYVAFRSAGSWRRQVVRAYFVYLPQQLLSFGVLVIAVRLLHLQPLLGQLLAIGVALVFSYLGHKYFTFRQPRLKRDESTEKDGEH